MMPNPTDSGSTYPEPGDDPGHYLPPEDWEAVKKEQQRLKDEETRLRDSFILQVKRES